MRLSRREFCLATSAGTLAAACRSDPSSPDGGADAGPVDGAAPADAASPVDGVAGDGSQGGGCAAIAGGPAAAVAVDQAVFAPGGAFYICRDAQGLYGMTARCTHAGCYLDFVPTPGFSCPCHDSTFDFNGDVVMGPAVTPLDHYALCVDADGNISLDPGTVVDPQKRY